MAGFVDVSNMSDLEVKRLCQQDEVDQPARRGRHVRPQPKMHDTDAVFAAAAAAFAAAAAASDLSTCRSMASRLRFR